MKKIAFFWLGIVFSGSLFAQETIEISGKIKGLGNDTMYLYYRFGGDRFTDTIVGKNDAVSFKKEIKLPHLVWTDLIYRTADDRMYYSGFFMSNETPIVLSGDLNNLFMLKASGSPLFDEVIRLREANQANMSHILALDRILSQEKDVLGEKIAELLDDKRDSLSQAYENVELNFMKMNKNSVYAAYLYSLNLLGKSAAEVEAHYNSLTEEVKNSPFGKQIFTYMETAKKVAPGAAAPAFTQKDINGKTVTLKQFKGKYVLLDFWGSWCGPCRRSHPHLMELVNKYKNEKFQVIGFASDKNKDKWKEAIEKDKLDFIHCNLFDKYKGEDVGALYNVKAFPTKMLIDPQGKIVGTVIGMGDEESEQLDEMLKAAFGK